ncbi:hypothetical protein AgCh_024205 [Apium graveolens]
MAKVIFLAGTAECWSYERSDTLVRMSVNTSGEKSETHVRKRKDAQHDEVITVEKLIAEAYSAIDKAVKVGTLHMNTGARRKSRLARRKKAVEIHHSWYTASLELTT